MSNNPFQENTSLDPIPTNSITDIVIAKILHAIIEGVFPPGERIPSEPKLAIQLGVSRNTVREAINSLAEKGLVYRQRGIGTFISSQSPKLISANLASALGTSELIKAQNKIPGQKNFSCQKIVPPDRILDYLELKPGALVVHISRLRTADGVPFSQSEEYIPLGVPKLSYDFSGNNEKQNWSLYGHFSACGYEVNSVVTHVHAISANAELAKNLQLHVNEAILMLEQTHYSNNSLTPILHATNYHNDKRIDMMIVRAGLGKGH